MIAKKAPNPIDKHVCSRVRMRRMMLNMSQEKLGDALGLTFQQVQKYEKGVNRVGAGRLFQIAAIFGLPISSFFDETGESTPAKSSRTPSRSDPLSIRLVEAFSKLPDTRSRLALLTVAESMNRIRKG